MVRNSKKELEKYFSKQNVKIYVAELDDKFSSLGLVIASIVKRDENNSVIESFVMSCRAMGFDLESHFLRRVVECESIMPRKIRGRFIPSDRNMPASNLYKKNNFNLCEEGEWHLSSVSNMPDGPAWFTVVDRG